MANPLVPRGVELTKAIEKAHQKPLGLTRLSLRQPVDRQASIISSQNKRQQRPITLAGQKATDDKG